MGHPPENADFFIKTMEGIIFSKKVVGTNKILLSRTH